MKGIVIKSTGSWFTVKPETGPRVECKLKGRFRIQGLKATNPVAVGDRVLYEFLETEGIGIIYDILPRNNYIIRRATKLSKVFHILAANIDRAYLIVTVVSPRTSTGFIDRFLVTTEAYHIPATLVFNKIDIYDQFLQEYHDQMVKVYQTIGYKCIAVSALRGDNIGDFIHAIELLEAFWIKFNNHPAPPKVGVTAEESNTYTDFSLINLGGVKPDGSDGVNELSYIILDVIEEMRLLQPSSMVQLSKKNPDRFLHRAFHIIKTGFGQPSVFNTDAIIQELLRQGKDIVDARNGGASGCVETGAFGTESYILTGYFNLTKILELVLHNGLDPLTGKQSGLKTGNPEDFETFDQLADAFQKQLRYFIDIKIKGNNIIEKLFATYIPVPFLSILIDDCVAKGKDYNAGGTRYNTNYIQGVGLGSLTDNLTSLKYHVFDKKTLIMSEMIKAVDANFDGWEELRYQLVYHTPKYGNDEDYADEQAKLIFEIYYQAVNGRPTARGGTYRINMNGTSCRFCMAASIMILKVGSVCQQFGD